ncbi:MAG TPA: sulfatase-like hydrolase/transferase, partial [Steroidobacteraceae bacterium]|nr:sulfatase-like hydrolase/transferase [Steroidobacteraceae bacterium]
AVFVHLLLGAAAWGLARLTAAALPHLDARHDRAVIFGWFVLLAGLAIALNGSWYPESRFAGLDGAWQGPLSIVAVVAGTTTAVLVAGLSIAAWARGRGAGRRRNRGAVIAAALAAVTGLSLLQGATGSPVARDLGRPHVVILGVDSLRNDMSEATADGRSLTPRIDEFLRGAHRFTDTTSPLARTYGSWVSILTGRHPVSTNARFNLMPRKLVHEGDTLADALSTAGYRSVYATDEVRFANFDESYGFDQFITPPVGASDFLLGKIGDLPLVNLVAGSAAGRWLFPGSHANRAAYVTYEPEDFVARLDGELEIRQPSFLAIHLTLAHWPYSWAGQVTPSTPPENRDAYRRAIAAVDLQFDAVVEMLRRKGVLDNAVVVVLSDHGEALGFPSDTMLRKTGTADEIWNSIWGHGTSVMSPHQYSVLLAMRAFGRAALPGEGGAYDWPVSLEDVRPTLEEIATGRAPGDVDGVSLLPYLAQTAPASALEQRLRYTETCFNTPMMLAGRIETSGLVTEAIEFYELVPETGWVQLRQNRLPELMAKKQRAVLSRGSLLAAVPSWKDDSVSFLYTSRRSPLPRRLDRRPDPSQDPEAARLWDALHVRFAGELAAPAGLP